MTLLDVRLFVVGGGFGAAFDVLEPGIRAGLAERSYGRRSETCASSPLLSDPTPDGSAQPASRYPSRSMNAGSDTDR